MPRRLPDLTWRSSVFDNAGSDSEGITVVFRGRA